MQVLLNLRICLFAKLFEFVYSSSLSASTIAGNRTSFTTISVCSATAQWYVIRYAVSHHNHQGCITISNLFPFLLLTLRHRWSVYVATPFHPHLTYSIHRNSLDNHGTSHPLRWCRQSEPFIFIGPGSAKNNFFTLPLSHSAQGRPVCF